MSLPPPAYHSLFEHDPDALAVVDPETGAIRECNQRCRELLDADRGEVVGRDVSSLVAPERMGDVVASRADGDHADRGPIECRLRLDGESSVPVEIRTETVTADGEALVLARIRNRPERERETRRKARAVDESPIGISISDPSREDNPLIYVNDAFERITGYDGDEVVGCNCRFLQGDGTDPEPVGRIRAAIDAEEPVTVTLRNYRSDGTEFWNRVTVAPVYDADGELQNFVGFQQDVTARKRDRNELELAHDLLETVQSGVFRTDPTASGTFEYVNSGLVSLLDADSAEQLREHRVAEFFPNTEDRERVVEALRESDDGDVTQETELVTLDGERRDVLLTASLSTDETGTEHVHGVVQDVTERRRRDAALRNQQELLDQILAAIDDVFYLIDDDGDLIRWNESLVDVTGYDDEEIASMEAADFFTGVDRERVREAIAEGARTERFKVEASFTTNDGEQIPYEFVANTFEHPEEGTVLGGIGRNISERLAYEQRVETQRDNLETLNQMLRHDIRNDLQLVVAYADVLADHVDEGGREYLETIDESADHAVELTRTARDMADVMLSDSEASQRVDLRTALERELDDVRSEHPDAVLTAAEAIPSVAVRADEMLDSVFRNLLTNAIRHNDKEIPEVSVSVDDRDETVVVRITDNGPGVPDNQKGDIFGRGEKGMASEGTGIGLYLVETLVDAYGGDVWVEDNEPEGAVFVVELQKAD
jgi:PAS domain S-box-containing protein